MNQRHQGLGGRCTYQLTPTTDPNLFFGSGSCRLRPQARGNARLATASGPSPAPSAPSWGSRGHRCSVLWPGHHGQTPAHHL